MCDEGSLFCDDMLEWRGNRVKSANAGSRLGAACHADAAVVGIDVAARVEHQTGPVVMVVQDAIGARVVEVFYQWCSVVNTIAVPVREVAVGRASSDEQIFQQCIFMQWLAAAIGIINFESERVRAIVQL